MTNRKRRLGGSVFDLDDETWHLCKSTGINDVDVKRMQRELASFGIKSTAKVAAAIAIREMRKRGVKM